MAARGAPFEIVNGAGEPLPIVTGFLRYLTARGCSPNTVSAYAHDLLHFFRFLDVAELSWQSFGPPQTIGFLEYLRAVPARRPSKRPGLAVVADSGSHGATRLSPPTVNRVLAAVSSFYDYLILSGSFTAADNPLQKRPDPAAARLSERHRPIRGRASRQRPMRRSVASGGEACRVPSATTRWTRSSPSSAATATSALVLVMLEGGLRPGKALGLQLADISPTDGAASSFVAATTTQRACARSRAPSEISARGGPWPALSTYAMGSRPKDVESGLGLSRRGPRPPTGRAARLMRHSRGSWPEEAERAGIREPWVTPAAAASRPVPQGPRMWESGCASSPCNASLGHASAESNAAHHEGLGPDGRHRWGRAAAPTGTTGPGDDRPPSPRRSAREGGRSRRGTPAAEGGFRTTRLGAAAAPGTLPGAAVSARPFRGSLSRPRQLFAEPGLPAHHGSARFQVPGSTASSLEPVSYEEAPAVPRGRVAFDWEWLLAVPLRRHLALRRPARNGRRQHHPLTSCRRSPSSWRLKLRPQGGALGRSASLFLHKGETTSRACPPPKARHCSKAIRAFGAGPG